MYENQGVKDWIHVSRDSGAKIVFCHNSTVRARLQKLRDSKELVGVEHVVSFQDTWQQLMKAREGGEDDVFSLLAGTI